jgi:SRSO17 transposase
MADFMNSAATGRLESYFASIGKALGTDGRRASFAAYAMGLLGGAERKSVEPIAALACADPKRTDAEHQRLLHFMVDSPWSDREVRRLAAKYGLAALTAQEPVEAWIVDDTGFLKQGRHSVGVQRQYTGSAGKIANCQLATSLSVATRTEHLPIDFELYLPTSWTEDAARRREARIPDWVAFQTRPELALEMIRRAVVDGVPPGVVLADSAYGSSIAFRAGIRALDLHYIVAVDPQTVVAVFDKLDRRRDTPVGVRDLAFRIDEHGGFRRCTWRKGTKTDLSARFALRRVVPAYDAHKGIDNREALWLLIEWRDGETEPANYFFASLNSRMTKKQLIRLAMQRWRTERVYQDLKGELGLDHYEGRRYPGWHHHVSVALCCYAFIVAERVRRFPPSAGRPMENHAIHFAA